MATYREAQMRNSQYQFNTNHNGERSVFLHTRGPARSATYVAIEFGRANRLSANKIS